MPVESMTPVKSNGPPVNELSMPPASNDVTEYSSPRTSQDDDPSFEDLLSDVDESTVADELSSSLCPTLDSLALNENEGFLDGGKLRGLSLSSSKEVTSHERIKLLLCSSRKALDWLWPKRQQCSRVLELTEALALLSRNELWAAALTEHGILDFYLDVLQQNTDDSDEWVDSSIKIIANCCTRSLRVKHSTFPRAPIRRLIHRLHSQEKAAMAAMALSAICSGLDVAAQQLETHYHLTLQILGGLDRGSYKLEHMDFLLELIGRGTPYVDASLFTVSEVGLLIDCPHKFNLSSQNRVVVGHLLCHLIEDQKTHSLAFTCHLRQLMSFFLQTYNTELSDVLTKDVLIETANSSLMEKPPFDELEKLRTRIIFGFSNIAKSIGHLERYQPELVDLVKWLEASEPQIQICACMVLGNIVCYHPNLSSRLVEGFDLGRSLNHCIVNAPSQSVLTSALELLQNVGTLSNREALGKAGLLQGLGQRWESPYIFAAPALYHTRQLLHSCLSNVLVFLGAGAPKPEAFEPERTLFDKLLLAFDQTDDSTLVAEIGLVIVEMWRTLYKSGLMKGIDGQHISSLEESHLKSGRMAKTNGNKPIVPKGDDDQSPEDTQREKTCHQMSNDPPSQKMHSAMVLLCRVFTKSRSRSVTEPVMALIKSGNETLVSQGWFTLALMSMHQEGAEAVFERCIQDEDNFEILSATLKLNALRAGAQSNAIYLVTMLRRQLADDLSRRARLDHLPLKDALKGH